MNTPPSLLDVSDKAQPSEDVSAEPTIIQADSWGAAGAVIDDHRFFKTVKEIVTQGRKFIPHLSCTDGAIRTD